MANSERFVNLEPDGSVPVTIVGGAGAGGTSSTDEAAFVAGTTAGTPAMGVFQAVASTLANNELGIIALDADRNVKVNVVAGGAGGGDVNLIEVGGAAVALGQATMAASIPVVVASNQTAVPISAASLPLPTGASTAALQTQPGVDIGDVTVNNAAGASAVNIQDGGNTITVDGTVAITAAALPLPTGAATEATLAGVLTSTNFAAAFGTAGTADTQVLSVQGIASMTPVTVDGTVAVTNAGLTELAAAINASSQMDVNIAASGATVPVSNAGLTALNGAISGTEVQVDVLTSALPSGAATEATLAGVLTSANYAAAFGTAGTADAQVLSVQGIASMTPVQVSQATASNLNAQVVGSVAHDSADSGNPVKVGGIAIDYAATPTAVSANDRVNFTADRAGVQYTVGGHSDVLTLEHADTDGETNVAIITVSAGTRIVVTQIQAMTDEATTVGVGFRIGFATATTPTTTGVVLTHPGLVPGTGVSRGDGSGILGIGATDEDLRITSEAPTSGSLRVLVTYYTIAV